MSSGHEREGRKDALLEALADLVLAEGLGTMGLRGVAARLGTSDRMLIYYFSSKDQLVTAVLDRVSQKLAVILGAHSVGPRLRPGTFLRTALGLGRDSSVAPFMRLWSDVVARGARREVPYNDIAAKVVADWLGWIQSRLVPHPDLATQAAAILSIVEGSVILELARPGSTPALDDYLAGVLGEGEEDAG
ncbi:TetR family transcriptional regulator [Ameyamaea chiangmaiensis NBRC 103196]|uniref:TetR/AcrR family transcriptional regulator n=1 Tax=Ameyamaea chiangmaiensis TaxID=442969 RepID=A0A850PFY0_9PROT|nr:TetR/AcrR family transcriptional regulator [Ameyamaea chiangmaiensis]MBS4073608.1 TetR/AcrR family transcriptional regulator [Ameyamaea chiangmaiensis]NVN40051.1 TetR/AcrR family transcriptional regulator [Ameyamaea chiangmaiensis]GBQ69091.1 TetR family transcriptional regulator [Ameyamaea chiangmaiensis NBRC 103196]